MVFGLRSILPDRRRRRGRARARNCGLGSLRRRTGGLSTIASCNEVADFQQERLRPAPLRLDAALGRQRLDITCRRTHGAPLVWDFKLTKPCRKSGMHPRIRTEGVSRPMRLTSGSLATWCSSSSAASLYVDACVHRQHYVSRKLDLAA